MQAQNVLIYILTDENMKMYENKHIYLVHYLMCRHGSEPALSLTYSDKSSTSATISLGVGDEMTRDGYHPGE